MNEVDLGGFVYKIGKLPALTQFHCARRIAPAFATLGVSVSELSSTGKTLGQDDTLFAVMGKVSEVVATMTDADVDYVINACLGVVTRQQSDSRWAPIMRGNRPLFEDIDMPTMIQLTMNVLQENLGNFFPMGLGGSSTQNVSGAPREQPT